MAFNTEQFMEDNLVNADALVGLANHLNVNVPAKDTLRKWFERGTIPGEWWPVVLAMLELESGSPVSVVAYLRGNAGSAGSAGNVANIFD